MDEKLKKCYEVCTNECAKLDFEISTFEFVLENGIKILRVLVSKETDISMDELSTLNLNISNSLDVIDVIDEEYYLEVSSVGIEKELKSSSDITKAIGSYIYIKDIFNNEFYGDLLDYQDNQVMIRHYLKGVKKVIKIEKENIEKIRLAVKF